MSGSPQRNVALITLGCARNEVDSEELAGRLSGAGWDISGEGDADVLVVNTCGFVDSAKKDSIDALLAAADSGKKVVAVGCLAERYGDQLAGQLPEADAVLGFDSYVDISDRLEDVLAGRTITAHAPRDRRTLLPISPAHRPSAAVDVVVPGHAWLPTANGRHRLDDSPVASLKLASGCDRRCTFCAIPSFRGSFISRPADQVLAEAEWLASTGVRELVLVSENSTSYGKDLGDLRALEKLLPELGAIEGIDRVRVSYLQPAELRPGLIEAIAGTPGVAPYFDLSFQHANAAVLRRMKRFGGTEAFLQLLAAARHLAPLAGARSNVIVGFPGETDAEFAELEALTDAALDGIGVFGYSDEDGTDAVHLPGHLPEAEVAARVGHLSSVVDELLGQRAEDRIGESVLVLVERVERVGGGEAAVGRALHQGQDDGEVVIERLPTSVRVGDVIAATVHATDGVDLRAGVEPGPAPVTEPTHPRAAMSAPPRAPSRSAPRPPPPLPPTPPPDPIGDPVSRVSNWNVANALTSSDCSMVPVFAITLFQQDGDSTGWRVLAGGVFALASITDRIDGELARRRHLITELGKLADPIADKALIGTALVGLSVLGELPWWVTIVVLGRELGVTALRFWVIRHGVIPASRGGKVKTLLQAVAIGLYVLPLGGFLHGAAVVVMAAAIVMTLITGIDYVARAVSLRRRGRLASARN